MSARYSHKAKPRVIRNADRLSLSFDELRVQSEMCLDAPDQLVLGYTRTMMGFLLFCPQPDRIAMIGLGGGSLPKYCYAKLPDTSITVVEIDPQVIALRERFLVPQDDERFHVMCEDGSIFVRSATQDDAPQYDVLIVDGYTESGQPPSLSTQRFYNDCYACLKPEGILVVNLSDVAAGFDRFIARISHSFNKNLLVIDAEDSTNQIVFAGKGAALTAPYQLLLDRLAQLEAHLSVKLYRTLQAIRAARE